MGKSLAYLLSQSPAMQVASSRSHQGPRVTGGAPLSTIGAYKFTRIAAGGLFSPSNQSYRLCFLGLCSPYSVWPFGTSLESDGAAIRVARVVVVHVAVVVDIDKVRRRSAHCRNRPPVVAAITVFQKTTHKLFTF